MTTDSTRDRLLDSAGKVFADKGFEAATVREICQEAGANIAAVNYYFRDKETLYLEAVKRAQCVRVELAPMPEWTADTPAPERLRQFIHVFLERLIKEDRPDWHKGLMFREMARPTAAGAAVIEDYIRPMAEQLRAILHDLLPPDTAQPDAFLVGFSIVGQCLYHYAQRPIAEQLMGREQYAALSLEKIAEHIARFSLAALGYVEPLAAEQAARANR